VVSDVTSETTFSLKSIYLMKREHEGDEGIFLAFLLYFSPYFSMMIQFFICFITFEFP